MLLKKLRKSLMSNELSLEKLRIAERLASLEASVSDGFKRNSEEHQSLVNSIERFDHVINGNGSVGIKTRVDRLEQIAELRRWILGFLIPTVLSLVGYAAHEIFLRVKS